MVKNIKKAFCYLLAVALSVTCLLSGVSTNVLAADSDETDAVVYYVGNEDDFINAMSTADYTDVIIYLTSDFCLSQDATSTNGRSIPLGSYSSSTKKTTIYTRTIYGQGHTISVSDEYTANSSGAMLYMRNYNELNLYDVTIDGGQKTRCIYENQASTLHLYDGAIIKNGGGSATSGHGITVAASSSKPSYLYMEQGSAVKDCVASAGCQGIGISATGAYIDLKGEVSGNTVSEDAGVSAAVYGGGLRLSTFCSLSVYEGAKITDNSVAGTTGTSLGGAIYSAGASCTTYMYGGTISGNSAASGGAIYDDGSKDKFYIYGGSITGNTAAGGQGGAIYAGHNLTLTIADLQSEVTISGNSATREYGSASTSGKGAGIYDATTVNINNSSEEYTVSITDNYDIVTQEDEAGNESTVSSTLDDVFQVGKLNASGSVEIGSIRMGEDYSLTLDGALTGSIGIYPLSTEDQTVVAQPADDYSISGTDLGNLYSRAAWCDLGFNSDGCVVTRTISETATVNLSGATVTVNDATYTGEAQEPVVSVLLNGAYLSEGTDYSVVYLNNTDAGTATVYVYGEGDYTGSAEGTFQINAKNIADEDVTLADLGTYYTADSTSELEPDVELSYGDLSLENGTDYTLSYKDNAAVGTATVTITGTGNYTGTRTTTFTIAEYDLEEGQTAAIVHDQETLEDALNDDSVAVILFANDISIDSKAEVARDVIIDGNGNTLSASAALTISSSAEDNAILSVTSGKLTLQHITVAGGDTSMAARNLYVASGAEAVLEDTAVLTGGYITTANTTARNLGTTIHNEGTLTLDGCTIRDAVYDTTVVTIYNKGEITMKDGTEITNVGGRYGVVYNAGDFTMDGGTFTAGYESAPSFTSTYAVFLRGFSGSTFTMNGGTIDGVLADGETYVSASASMVYSLGTITMNDGTVCHYGGSGYAVRCTGTFTMNDGTIADNTSRGVSSSGTFTMNGGTIANNASGGVYSSGTFTMESGTIENNEVYGTSTSQSGIGAGVYLYSGTFTMNGGTIQNNTAYMLGSYAATYTAAGAGIYNRNAAMVLNSGTITGNSIVVNQADVDSYGDRSGRGAGIYIGGSNSASLDISGTTISGNKIYTVEAGAEDDSEKVEASFAGTGIFVYDYNDNIDITLSISGSGDISITDDVYLPTESNAFTINDTLLPTGRNVAISVTLPTDEAIAGRTIASYADGVKDSEADAACFTETSGLDVEYYSSDSGSVIRIPSVEVKITDVQLSGEDTDTYTYVYEYDDDGNITGISGVYYTGTEIIPALTITAQYTDDNGTVQTVTLSDSQYTVTGSNNTDVTSDDDPAVLTVSSTGTYDFDDFTVNFQIVKATAEQNVISFSNASGSTYVTWDEDLNAYVTSQIMTGSIGSGTAVYADIQYLDGVVFGETSSIEGATVSIASVEPLTGDGYTYAGPQDENDPIYADTFATTDLYGEDTTIDGYTVNCVGTVKVTFEVKGTDNYEASTQTLYVTIAKADQGLQYDEDLDITTPSQQGKVNYYSISGEVYSTLDLGLKAYRIYNSYAYRRDTSGGTFSTIESSKSYDTDTELDTTITISYSTGTDVDGNTVYDTDNPANNVVYPVSAAGSSTYDAAGTLIYLAKQGTATVVIQAAGNDYYNESSIALTSDTQNWVNGLGFTGNLKITVDGLTQTVTGMTMAVGDGDAETLTIDEDGYYQAEVDYIDVDGKTLTFTPASNVGENAEIYVAGMNSASISQTGDKLAYSETVDLAVSEDGKSVIITPKAAGTVSFYVYMKKTGDYAISNEQRITLTINESTPELTCTLTDYDEDIVTIADDGTITACADSAAQIAFTTETDAASLALSYASSDTSVATVSGGSESDSHLITITGLGNADVTLSATGNKGYKDVAVTIPVSTTLHQFGTDEVDYVWSDDYSTCTAYEVCESCGETIEIDCTVTSSYEDEYEVTSTDEDGNETTETLTDVMVYTAAATYNGITYEDTQVVEDSSCEHNYKALTYRWTLDAETGVYTCTGTFECSACGDIEVAAQEAELTDSTVTCMTDGQETYTAVFTVGDQAFTRTLTVNKSATGEHEYGDVTFTWSEDYSTCTATRTCIYADGDEACAADEDSTQTVECTVTAETTTEATCTEDGEVTYTATAVFDAEDSSETTDTADASSEDTDDTAAETFTDTQTVTIAATGHSAVNLTDEQYRAFVWTENEDGTYSCTLYFYCTVCGEQLDAYVNADVTSEVTAEPTCTTDGVVTYTATATYRSGDTEQTFTDTMTAAAAATGHDTDAVNLETGERSCSVCGEVSTDSEAAEVIVYLEESLYTYDGSAKEPSVAVLVDGTALKEDTDFTVTYESNTDEGTAIVTVTGTGNYSGTVTKTFLIQTEELSEETATLSLDVAEYTYTGSAITPAVTVTDAEGNVLVEGTDYEVVYSDNTGAGTAAVTVVGIGNYSGSLTAAYTITAKDISDATLAIGEAEVYSGTAVEPAVTVTDADGNVLVEGTDYTVSYTDNTKAGTATVTVTGTGNYTGTLAGTYTVKTADTLVVRRGNTYYFSYTLKSGAADKVISYGKSTDEVFFGDWDGDGVDTICVRRGNTYYFSNSLKSGSADTVITYGRSTDEVLVGDWDGDGKDTLAVRRGNTYYFSNSIKSGSADKVVAYGKSTDTVLVGDWDGDGTDTLAVRRGNTYYISNTIKSGSADKVVAYGKSTDTVLVGDWDGDGMDTLTVRRGNAYYISNTIKSGTADQVIYYGKTTDEVYAGKWN